jgi:hypothetical protein
MVASQWENKVAFVDMTPLFQFVRSVYVEPIQNMDNRDLYTQAITSTPWPFDFTTNPEMTPSVVTTIDVDQPRLVRFGIKANQNGKGLQKLLLAYVASLDGRLAAYDVTSLAAVHEVGSVMADPNPTSLHLLNANDQLSVSSRGNRSVQWLQVNEASIDITETFRDSRVNDPVSTDKNQRMPVITIGDFSSGQVFGFERGETAGTYLFEGAMQYPGAVYFVDTANVN